MKSVGNRRVSCYCGIAAGLPGVLGGRISHHVDGAAVQDGGAVRDGGEKTAAGVTKSDAGGGRREKTELSCSSHFSSHLPLTRVPGYTAAASARPDYEVVSHVTSPRRSRSDTGTEQGHGRNTRRREVIPDLAEVRVGENETFESALRRFNKKIQQSGILAEARRREHYEKPSVKRKRKEAKRKKNARSE